MQTTTVIENWHCGKYSTVKLHVCPGARNQLDLLSWFHCAACFFPSLLLHLLSTGLSSNWLLLSYLRLPAGAQPPVFLYSHLNGSLTDAGFLAPGSNRPICALDEVMSGWLYAKATKVAKWRLPLRRCWITIQTHSEADENKCVCPNHCRFFQNKHKLNLQICNLHRTFCQVYFNLESILLCLTREKLVN